METTTEEWRYVKGYEGRYRVSSHGNVIGLLKHKQLAKMISTDGFEYHCLSKTDENSIRYTARCLVHRMVAEAFVDNPNNYKDIIHIDGNKRNNHAENLMYCEPILKKELRLDDLEGEEWREVNGFDGIYKISNFGRVKSHNIHTQGKILKPRDYSDYDSVLIKSADGTCKKHMVHRLVAEAFIPNPDNLPEVNHKNGDKHDNNVENLEWCTHQQNVKHAYNVLYLGCLKGEGCPTHKLTNEQVMQIYDLAKKKELTFTEIGKMFGVTRSVVTDIHIGKSWTHITNQEWVKDHYLTEQQAIEIYQLASSGHKYKEIAEKYNISESHVSEIRHGKCFAKVIKPLIEMKKRNEVCNSTPAEFYS